MPTAATLSPTSRRRPTSTPRWPPEPSAVGEAAAARAARQRSAVITTTAATALFKLEPGPLAALRDVQRANLAKLQAAGVQLLVGSDVFIGTARAELHAL